MQHEFRRTLEAARFFRMIGLVPLPSRMDRKRPLLAEYARYRTKPVPPTIYSEDQWRTTNLQLLTGAATPSHTKIVVVDLDGELAEEAWRQICRRLDYRPASIWIARTGSGGKHLYYRLPPGVDRCASRLIWGLWDPLGGPDGTGGWLRHTEARLLGDNALVVAPPSRHVKTGIEYQWVGKWSPGVFALPELAPDWLIQMTGVGQPAMTTAQKRPWQADQPAATPAREFIPVKRRDEILNALTPGEKLRMAVLWGLRVAPGASPHKTWVACHAFDRKDDAPSAGFCPQTGVYHDFGGAEQKLSFFDLAVALGAYATWQEAMKAIEAYAAI